MAATTEERRRRSIDSDKDSTEEELERLIFGDSAGFRDNLRSFKDAREVKSKEVVLVDASDDDEEGRTGLEGLADKDLFFLDDTPGDAPVLPLAGEDDDSDSGRDGAAWSDSDDERITVSLTSRTQLRKLRKTAEDDLITGKEYSRRLRKQFQLLNPVPEWVQNASKPARKKRRTSSGSEATDSSADEMDIDDEGSLSAPPLARLLQDVDALTRTTSSKDGVRKKRRLREGTIDIQRMKDIVSHGPVSSCRSSSGILELIYDSLQSRAFKSTPRFHSSYHPAHRKHSHCTISDLNHQTQTHYSQLSISRTHHSIRHYSILPNQTRESSFPDAEDTCTFGT